MSSAERSIVFDTETTGLDPADGHRLVEIACLEMIRDLPTGRHFHTLIDPERDVPEDAVRVHGFTRAHLLGKPRFADIVDAMLEFIADDKLIAHNAEFDFGFLDAELVRIGRPKLDRQRMVCTWVMAKTRFAGLPNSLDALCRRYGIDLSERTTHSALLDCRLLCDVYLELTGGRQKALLLEDAGASLPAASYAPVVGRRPVLIEVDDAAIARHVAFLSKLKEPVWQALMQPSQGERRI